MAVERRRRGRPLGLLSLSLPNRTTTLSLWSLSSTRREYTNLQTYIRQYSLTAWQKNCFFLSFSHREGSDKATEHTQHSERCASLRTTVL